MTTLQTQLHQAQRNPLIYKGGTGAGIFGVRAATLQTHGRQRLLRHTVSRQNQRNPLVYKGGTGAESLFTQFIHIHRDKDTSRWRISETPHEIDVVDRKQKPQAFAWGLVFPGGAK
jgi:hypothetical protein